MARDITTQFQRYEREYAKRLARTKKFGLKPSQQKYNLLQFETEVLTLRQQNATRPKNERIKDIAEEIAKKQTVPFTPLQVENLMRNAIVTNPDGSNQWSPELNSILDTLNLHDKYDGLLNDRSYNRTLRLTKMVTEVYDELKKYLETHEGETEALSELIGEAFWGS